MARLWMMGWAWRPGGTFKPLRAKGQRERTARKDRAKGWGDYRGGLVDEAGVRAFESEIEVLVELIEALPIDSGSRSYPLPRLARTGTVEPRVFSTFVLENSYLRAEFVPALGGRLLRLRDRRLGVELLYESGQLRMVDDPIRGLRLEDGLAFFSHPDRLALGPVQAQLDMEEGEIWIEELVPGTSLSYHLRAKLAEERAALQFEVRVVNRGLEPCLANPGLGWGDSSGERAKAGNGWFVAGGLAGRGIDSSVFGSSGGLCRFPEAVLQTGRTSESFSLEFVPVDGIGEVVQVSEFAAVSFRDDALVVSTYRELPGAKLILLSQSGKTLETAADLLPERPLVFSFAELGGRPGGLVIRAGSGDEVLRFSSEDQLVEWKPTESSFAGVRKVADTSGVGSMSEMELGLYSGRVEFRHLVAARRVMDAFRSANYSEAALRAEQELLYNGDDPLGWIEKAVAARLDVSDSEIEIADGGELANGHFLAPLEPLLRAEAFFRMPSAEGSDAARFLEPLRQFPDELIEVGCFLVERGLYVDAGRWLTEIMKLSPSPMVAYLSAYCYLVASDLKVQAAELVSQAARMPMQGPFPWREMEKVALRRLSEAFPSDGRLVEFARMV